MAGLEDGVTDKWHGPTETREPGQAGLSITVSLDHTSQPGGQEEAHSAQ